VDKVQNEIYKSYFINISSLNDERLQPHIQSIYDIFPPNRTSLEDTRALLEVELQEVLCKLLELKSHEK